MHSTKRLTFTLIALGLVLVSLGVGAKVVLVSSPAECKGATTCPIGTVKVYLETAGRTSVFNPNGRVCGCLTVAE